MAKYNMTFSCGHDGVVDLIGKGSERERKIRWYESSALCPECYKKAMGEERARLEKEREEELDAAKENAAEFGWPQLEGTEKQIKWATTLRQEFYDKLVSLKPNKEGQAVIAMIIDRNTNASAWIDNRESWRAFFSGEYKKIKSEPEPAPVVETVVEPEDRRYPDKAVIEIAESKVSARYQRNDAFIEIVKGLGYEWDVLEHVWAKEIGIKSGNAADRAAEIGNKLLLNGFAIQIEDAEIRQAAIDGTYEHECKRWVSLYVSGKYKGWLCVSFPRNDDLYNAAKSIPGSKWYAPNVVVPVPEWESVLDFADTYNFKLTSAAQDAIDAYKKAVIIAIPTENQEKQAEDKNVADVLNGSREVLDDLKDD